MWRPSDTAIVTTGLADMVLPAGEILPVSAAIWH